MSCTRILLIGLVAVGILAVPEAAAQCQNYDFENLAVGTAVTNQYDGVTFSTVGNSCGGSPDVFLRIQNQTDGHSFGSKVLLIDTGCPDFSPDYLRMVFDLPQRAVSFTLGPWYGTYAVRAYSTTSGGTPISTQNITIPGDGFVGCNRLVRVVSAAGNIRRIEVQETVGLFEAIDNLSFNEDDTPPQVELTDPAAMSCVCGTILVRGVACEPDGMYDRDRLEYLRVYPPGGTDWTLIGEVLGHPVCEPGNLYFWNTTPAEITDGLYVLRLTATNACGLSASAVTTVAVSKNFDSLTVRQPLANAILGGNVGFDGTVWDEFCFEQYVVEYQPAAGGDWQPVDPLHPTYTSAVVTDPFATWATAGVITDGSYHVRVVATTHCGSAETNSRTVTIDNSPPVGLIQSPTPCQEVSGVVPVIGTANDAHLYQWELAFYNTATNTWMGIHSGGAPVVNGLLANWDTASLPGCYYLLRLRVWDNAIVDNCGAAARHLTEDYLVVAVNSPCCPGDINRDGVINFDDINPFVSLLSGGGGHCP